MRARGLQEVPEIGVSASAKYLRTIVTRTLKAGEDEHDREDEAIEMTSGWLMEVINGGETCEKFHKVA